MEPGSPFATATDDEVARLIEWVPGVGPRLNAEPGKAVVTGLDPGAPSERGKGDILLFRGVFEVEVGGELLISVDKQGRATQTVLDRTEFLSGEWATA